MLVQYKPQRRPRPSRSFHRRVPLQRLLQQLPRLSVVTSASVFFKFSHGSLFVHMDSKLLIEVFFYPFWRPCIAETFSGEFIVTFSASGNLTLLIQTAQSFFGSSFKDWSVFTLLSMNVSSFEFTHILTHAFDCVLLQTPCLESGRQSSPGNWKTASLLMKSYARVSVLESCSTLWYAQHACIHAWHDYGNYIFIAEE